VPPYSISRDEDRVHQGFKALDDYILKHHPKHIFYGHFHQRQRHQISGTEAVGIVGKEFVRINN
jgi:Icc-related predicted phosphoesterase